MPTKQKIVYAIFGIALIIFGIGGITHFQNNNTDTQNPKVSILDSVTQNSQNISQTSIISSSSQTKIEPKIEPKNAKLEIKNLNELQVNIVKKSNNPIQICFRNLDKCTDKDKIITYFDGIEGTTTYSTKNGDSLRLIPNTSSIVDPNRKDQLKIINDFVNKQNDNPQEPHLLFYPYTGVKSNRTILDNKPEFKLDNINSQRAFLVTEKTQSTSSKFQFDAIKVNVLFRFGSQVGLVELGLQPDNLGDKLCDLDISNSLKQLPDNLSDDQKKCLNDQYSKLILNNMPKLLEPKKTTFRF